MLTYPRNILCCILTEAVVAVALRAGEDVEEVVGVDVVGVVTPRVVGKPSSRKIKAGGFKRFRLNCRWEPIVAIVMSASNSVIPQ